MKTPKILRPTRLHMALPEDVRAKLDLYLYSEVENRVPFGAYQAFFVQRIREFFSETRTYLNETERELVRSVLTSIKDKLVIPENVVTARGLLEKLK